jgi:lipopolysaccharide/colanic/teichoic acid biosynthesis glycosyltransferase
MDFLNENQNQNDNFTSFKNCIVGQTFDGFNIYSLKKMVEQVKEDGLDDYDAEEFVLRNTGWIKKPGDLILYDIH